MTVEKNEVNWDTVQEASRIVAKNIRRKMGFVGIDADEIRNECIMFMLADTPRSKKLNRYTHGDTTNEKLNKLVYSLNTDLTWLGGIFGLEHMEQKSGESYKTVRLDVDTCKEIVRKTFSGEKIDSESVAIIADKLTNRLSKSQKDILISVYTKPHLSKKQIAIDHGVSWRWVYGVISKAVSVAGRVDIPMHSRSGYNEESTRGLSLQVHGLQ